MENTNTNTFVINALTVADFEALHPVVQAKVSALAAKLQKEMTVANEWLTRRDAKAAARAEKREAQEAKAKAKAEKDAAKAAKAAETQEMRLAKASAKAAKLAAQLAKAQAIVDAAKAVQAKADAAEAIIA
jgi:hypothetical protein